MNLDIIGPVCKPSSIEHYNNVTIQFYRNWKVR